MYLPDAAATVAAGEGLAPGLRGGMIVTLSGELGAGKTTLVRGMLRGLGWAGAVKSPTYALVEHYTFSSLYFYHFDFYRFESAAEWDISGFAEYFHPAAICVIEWPERVAARLPLIDVALSRPGPADGCASWPTAGRACLAPSARILGSSLSFAPADLPVVAAPPRNGFPLVQAATIASARSARGIPRLILESSRRSRTRCWRSRIRRA